MFDENNLLDIFINEMPVQLECTTPGCNHGEAGIRWKTQPLTEYVAQEMLKLHRTAAHGQQIGGGGGVVYVGGEDEDYVYENPGKQVLLDMDNMV